MEKPINWRLELSLKDMVLRRVAMNFFNQTDVLASILDFEKGPTTDKQLEAIENKVKEKISKLVLHESLKRQIMYLVKPICFDTIRWKLYLEEMFDYGAPFEISILEQIIRTPAGIIDYRKTAEQLVHLELFSEVERYQLACNYCLVDYITDLWKKLPSDVQIQFYNEGGDSIRNGGREYNWPFILKGEDYKVANILQNSPHKVSFCQFAFRRFACKGNKSAADYFFQKLPHKNRDSLLFETVNEIISHVDLWIYAIDVEVYSFKFKCAVERPADVVSYLLSLMSSKQQMSLLKARPCEVLKCFLDWPWQDLFMDLADVIWAFLPDKGYRVLIDTIIANFRTTNCYYPIFFQALFLSCPGILREHFADRWDDFFTVFLNAEDTETIKVVFRASAVEDRKRIVYDFYFFERLHALILTGKSHLIKLCLQEAKLSKREMEKLKESYFVFLSEMRGPETRLTRRTWKELFESLEETNTSKINTTETNKRRSESETSGKTKKLCSKKRK